MRNEIFCPVAAMAVVSSPQAITNATVVLTDAGSVQTKPVVSPDAAVKT